MILVTFKFSDAICESRFIKTHEKDEYLMHFIAIGFDGKIREVLTKIVSESVVCARLNTCREYGGTMAVIKNGVLTYKCDYE